MPQGYLVLAVAVAVLLAWRVAAKPRRALVHEYEHGLWFKRGQLVRVVGPGLYTVYAGQWWQHELRIIDLRETALVVNGQDILTKDNISVRLSVLAQYKIADAKTALLSTVNYSDRLYQEVQLRARELVASLELESLLAGRDALNESLAKAVQEAMGAYGLQVLTVQVKDLVLSDELSQAYAQAIKAQKEAAAALIAAREKVATARALANVAHIVKDNPAIIKLKELDILEQAASKYGTTFVVRIGGAEEPFEIKK